MVTVVVEEVVVVLLVVVVVVTCGVVVLCVAEKMLLVCVRCVIDGWIWTCQCVKNVACDVNGVGVDVVIGVLICGVWNVVWWICGVICNGSDVVSSICVCVVWWWMICASCVWCEIVYGCACCDSLVALKL